MEIGGVGVYRGRSRSVQGGEAWGGSGRRGGWGWLGMADGREQREQWLGTAGRQRAESREWLGTAGRQRVRSRREQRAEIESREQRVARDGAEREVHFLFFFSQHTHTLSHTLIRSLSSLSLSPVNHHNYRRNSGRIYRRKSIGDFLGSICFQYFKVKALSLRFLYFVSFFTNLSNLSVICDLI
jgi:hypothetical protein